MDSYEQSCKNCGCTEDLYILPCKHILCNCCINKCGRSNVSCGYCGQKYNKQYVIEYIENCSDDDDLSE